MFQNIFKKYFLCSVRNREMFMWTLLFPIALATMFHFAFSSLDEKSRFKPVPVGIVEDEAFKEEVYLEKMLEELLGDENPVIKTESVRTEKAADTLLKEGKVAGYIKIREGRPVLFVTGNGMEQTILKGILDRYMRMKEGIMEVPEVKSISFSSNEPSMTVNYFYALLAMACLFSGFSGLAVINTIQANLSPLGARNSVSPGNRGVIFAASFMGTFLIQCLGVTAALLYIRFVLGVDFGGQLFYAFCTCAMGSLVGISLGCVIALPARWKSGMKTAVMILVSMICCFFAGLMIGGVNYLVQEKAPVLAMLNPAARIADSFYCLYYYDNHTRYFQNMGILVLMAAGMLTFVCVCMRRKSYESI